MVYIADTLYVSKSYLRSQLRSSLRSCGAMVMAMNCITADCTGRPEQGCFPDTGAGDLQVPVFTGEYLFPEKAGEWIYLKKGTLLEI